MNKNPFVIQKGPHGDCVMKIYAEGIDPTAWEGDIMDDDEDDSYVSFNINLFPDEDIESIESVEELHTAIGKEIQYLQECERLLTLFRDITGIYVDGDWYRRDGDLNMRIYIPLTNPFIQEAFETYNNSQIS